MHRQLFLQALDLYARQGLSSADQQIFRRLRQFVEQNSRCFAREYEAGGHVTASALVTNTSMDQVLLTHHKKLGKWLQLGGHADGENNVASVALREAQEESGIKDLSFLTSYQGTLIPFDLDIHEIPLHKDDPAHLHYDCRFLIAADSSEALAISEESNDLRWFTIGEARQVCNELSMQRQFDKLDRIRNEIAESVLLDL